MPNFQDDSLLLFVIAASLIACVTLLIYIAVIARKHVAARRLESTSTLSDSAQSNQQIATLKRKLAERDKQLAFQHRSLTALLAISEASDDEFTLDVVFDRALRTMKNITNFDTVVLRLYDARRHCYDIMAQDGLSAEMLKHMKCAPVDADNLPSEATRRRWPVWVRDLTNNRFTWDGPIPARSGFHSVVSVPLLTEDRVLGTMELASLTEYAWEETELAWLALVGRTIGSIIYRVQLTNQMRDLATVEERSRLSQEIHDGLVQTIGAIRLWSENAADCIQSADYPSAANAVAKIETYARDGYTHLREEMMGLRNTITPGQDILPVIKEYMSRFQRQWGIDSQLIVTTDEGTEPNLSILPTIEIQLLRIIQEALTNVRRHAQSSNVVVTFEQTPEHLHVSVKDDGRGFSPQNLTSDNLGLKIMRERAASVGGRLNIESQHGQGTRVSVTIPTSKSVERSE
jgi:two-component system nitrate/nitrite sensor histidine kinase NarX